MFIFKVLQKQIKSVSVDRSDINSNEVALIFNFKGTDKALGLSMSIKDALEIAEEILEVVKEIQNEAILQDNNSDA